MDLLRQTLQAARQAAPSAPTSVAQTSLLLLGGGGKLGSSVLEQSLVAGRFARVWAVVAEPLSSAVRGFMPLPQATLMTPADLNGHQGVLAETALIVFERQRHSNGRDVVFFQPQPAELLSLAARLRGLGVRHLLVVVPHSPALLPQSLAHGLASLDEAAVVELDFDHLVFFRAAQHDSAVSAQKGLQRLASWWLSQLRWMVPSQEQPLPVTALARCVVQLARCLPAAPRGTRVMPPQDLWALSQDAAGLPQAVQRWLHPVRQP